MSTIGQLFAHCRSIIEVNLSAFDVNGWGGIGRAIWGSTSYGRREAPCSRAPGQAGRCLRYEDGSGQSPLDEVQVASWFKRLRAVLVAMPASKAHRSPCSLCDRQSHRLSLL